VNLPSEPHPRPRRYSARYQARLNSETAAKLEDLAKTFRRKFGPILRYVMQWGIRRSVSWSIDQSIPAKVHLVPLLVEPELLQHVQEAAAAHGASVAAWVRSAMRQVSPEDFPASWHATMTDVRTHDSPTYGRRFMLRLDETTAQKLQALVAQFGTSRAVIIRQLISQAKPEEFPESWHLSPRERHRR
jgi:predicted DNA-binding protein